MYATRAAVAALTVVLFAAMAAAQARAPAATAAQRRPNIVLIVADDLGFSDLGCYGGEIKTPNLDALAARGLRFTQFYNGARCCPTRASLMTGLYPHQAGVGRMTMDTGPDHPGYRGTLVADAVTLPEALKAAGYRTAMVGKWHLSLTHERPGHMKRLANQEIDDAFSDPATYPTGRGFEKHYGVIWGVVNYFDPFSLVDGTRPVREVPDDYYITDALTDHAVGYIDEFAAGAKADTPFFLYVAHVAPHWPLHAPEADVEKYTGTYRAGWEAVRAARRRRIAEMNLLPAADLPPAQGRRTTWEDNPTRDWDARAMATHAAMVSRMDEGVGRIVRKLEESKLLDDTLILFLSDNGASPEAYPNPGFDRPAQTRDGRKITYPPDKSVPPGREDTFFGMGPAWANVSNAPFRWWKAELYEGGICTPLIAHWPRGTGGAAAGGATGGGAITPQVGHVMDVMPTCLELAGASHPTEFNGRAVQPPEGKSLLPILRGGRREGHAAVGWEHFNARALRQGDWKLVARAGRPWELYDLSKDRTEQHDLAATEPARVGEMAKAWEQWARRVKVFPTPEEKPAPAERRGRP